MSFLLQLINLEKSSVTLHFEKKEGSAVLQITPRINANDLEELNERLRDVASQVPQDTVITVAASEGNIKTVVNDAPIGVCRDRGIKRMAEELKGLGNALLQALDQIAQIQASEEGARKALKVGINEVLQQRLANGAELTSPIAIKVICPSCGAAEKIGSRLAQMFGGVAAIQMHEDEADEPTGDTIRIGAPVGHANSFYELLRDEIKAWAEPLMSELMNEVACLMRDHNRAALTRLETAFALPPYAAPEPEDVQEAMPADEDTGNGVSTAPTIEEVGDQSSV